LVACPQPPSAQVLNHAHSAPLQTSHALFDIDASGYAPAERLPLKPRLLKTIRSHEAKRQRIQGVLAPGEAASPHTAEHAKSNLPLQDSKANALVPRQNNEANVSRSGYSKTDLSPCHICHQKPKVKSDLDSYADCELCGQRTCFICMRQCLGPPRLTDLADEDEDTRMALSLQMLMDDGLGGREAYDRDTLDAAGPASESHRDMVCSQCCVERGPDGELRCLGCLGA
jgi:hypothetical protein